jgi:hypothetical protein
MRVNSDGRRYPWTRAVEDIAIDLAERATSEQEFREQWERLGTVVRYLVTHDPRPVVTPVTNAPPPSLVVWRYNP